jgi:hypothetical protein
MLAKQNRLQQLGSQLSQIDNNGTVGMPTADTPSKAGTTSTEQKKTGKTSKQ